jgi:hypothetical protein
MGNWSFSSWDLPVQDDQTMNRIISRFCHIRVIVFLVFLGISFDHSTIICQEIVLSICQRVYHYHFSNIYTSNHSGLDIF